MKSLSEYTVKEKVKIIVLIFISILFLIFASQNWGNVKLELTFWQVNVSLFGTLLFSFLLGLFISFILGRVKAQSLKKVIHLRNEEIKSLKFELANKKDIRGINKKMDQLIDGSNPTNDLARDEGIEN